MTDIMKRYKISRERTHQVRERIHDIALNEHEIVQPLGPKYCPQLVFFSQ